jgi:peptidyl-prolyl cis-trans isomerase C
MKNNFFCFSKDKFRLMVSGKGCKTGYLFEQAIPPIGDKTMTKAAARHILVDSEELCLELKEKINNGEDFAALAEAHSSCPSGKNGGALGTFGPGRMVAEFDEVVFSAPIGEVQGPVKTQFGFHLLEVTMRS